MKETLLNASVCCKCCTDDYEPFESSGHYLGMFYLMWKRGVVYCPRIHKQIDVRMEHVLSDGIPGWCPRLFEHSVAVAIEEEIPPQIKEFVEMWVKSGKS